MRRLIISLILMVLLSSLASAMAIFDTPEPIANDDKKIIDVTTSTFSNYTKIYTSDFGVIIETEKVSFHQADDNIKFDIDYSGINADKSGWRCTFIKSEKPILKKQGIKWAIDGKDYFFTMFYKTESCEQLAAGKELYQECTYSDKVKLELITENALKVCWKPENLTDLVYDPVITDWDDGNLTALYYFNSSWGLGLTDYSANGLDMTAEYTNMYNTEGPKGSNDAVNMNHSGRFKLTADSDVENFDDFSMFSAYAVVNISSLTDSKGKFLSTDGALNWYNDECAGTNLMAFSVGLSGGTVQERCYWYSTGNMDANEWHNISIVYNGSHVYMTMDGTHLRDRTGSGTGNDVGNYVGIGKEEYQNPLNYTSISCFAFYNGGYLDDTAEADFFNSCYPSEEEPPAAGFCDCPTDADFTLNFTAGCYYNTTCDIDGYDFLTTGTGTIKLNATFTGDTLQSLASGQNILMTSNAELILNG